MSSALENYRQRLFEVAAEYGRAGRLAYHELDQHIDDAIDNKMKHRELLAELGEPENAIRRIIHADGKSSYPLHKLIASGFLIVLGLGFLAGISALLMPLGSRIAGMQVISGDPVNLPYTVERCADFMRIVPTATDCRQAAMLHHYFELTDERITFAVLCLISILVFGLLIKKDRVHLLPKKMLLVMSLSIYIIFGGLLMLLAVGDLSAGRDYGWLADFLTGVPMFMVGILILAYYLGFTVSRRGLRM